MTMAMKLREEREYGMIAGIIEFGRENKMSNDTIVSSIMKHLHISRDEAQEKLDEYDEVETAIEHKKWEVNT